jgi:hypothetical protein
MANKILAVLAAALVAFLVVVALQPGGYRVTRSTTVAAPPATLFAQVNELKNWEAWNPWGKIDPAMKMTYDGPPSGVGASYHWVGNSEVGEGKLTITRSVANESIGCRMDFVKPMAGISDAEFTFKPEGDQTTVTWTMTGTNNFIAKAFCLFMSMDKMVGGQFERGLANLKAGAEPAKP